jgi:protein involved in plasmid replication-relaxation
MTGRAGRSISRGILTGLAFMYQYRFLTIPQFARLTGYSIDHVGEVLRNFERRQLVGYFGFLSIPGHGRTPKVYYVKRKGWELLRTESDEEPEGAFAEVSPEHTWTPQMYHRLRLLDLMVALEVQVRTFPHIELVRTFIEYRRHKGTYVRETTDYVAAEQIPDNRIIPDGAFILENLASGRRALFFIEMDMGTERIATKSSKNTQATILAKLTQYDRYLTSGRFATTYGSYGEFRSFLLLFVTSGEERIVNIRQAASSLSGRLHGYYRFATFEQASTSFLGGVWRNRSPTDTLTYAIVQA